MAVVPFKVKAVFEYTSSHDDDLPFQIGQIITVTSEEDADWYGGEYVDDTGVTQEGIFPRNFVEKFEPTAPPRPTRTRKRDIEPASSARPAPAPPSPPPAAAAPSEEEVDEVSVATPLGDANEPPAPVPEAPPVEQPHPPEVPSVPVANPPEIAPVPAPARIESKDVDAVGSSSIDAPPQPKSPPLAQARSPPPVSQKPSSNSFKDRIAAFNKPAAPPVAPFKPSGLGSGSSGFIKKPFVAPPPSRHAYVPPPRDTPVTRIYRREEDPGMKETQAESVDAAEKARPTPSGGSDPQDEDQPKPTTLKERIALLQKQQAEAAQRHAGAVAKKEKPAQPPKKRLESNGQQETTAVDQAAEIPSPLDRKDSVEITSKNSMDESHSARQSLNIHRTSTGPIENDGNEADMSGAGDTTEGQEDLTGHDDSDEKLKPIARESTAPAEQVAGEDGEEEDDDVDPEIRRKEELRARIAKMSGGMGMAGMFGPPGMMGLGGSLPAKKPKPSTPAERGSSGMSEGPSSPRAVAPPIPTMMALPGMRKQKEPEEVLEPELKQDSVEEETTTVPISDRTISEPESKSQTTGAPPPIPAGRPAPPPIPTESRPPPPPPPAAILSPSIGSESDDELSENTSKSLDTPKAETSPTSRGPPPIPMASPPLPTRPRFSSGNRSSYLGDETSPVSPGLSPSQSKRNSRPPPPIPGIAPPAPTQTRPPPLPPGTALSRASTADELTLTPMNPGRQDDDDEEVTEYEGDYDTDIAPSAHHKDALKAHARESSFDDSSSVRSPAAEFPPTLPPPVPSSIAPRAGPPPIPTPIAPNFRTSVDIPRAGPPPIPSQPAPRSRASVDIPRAAPPPPPKQGSYTFDDDDDDDYDPYNYNAIKTPPISSHKTPVHEETEGFAPLQAPPLPPSSTDRRAPPLTPTSSKAPLRKSTDILRPSIGKRSMDAGRPSISLESGFMANEIDLSSHTQWWLLRHGVPPAFQGRKDIHTESNESKSTEDGRKFVTKEVMILFQDYSQTIITVRYDPKDPSQTELGQRHDPPPRTLRQDELEEAYERFGRRLAHSVASKKDSVVGDGTPQALVHELLRPLKEALLPVGTRAYGALVYANLANAATQLNDEIRPGDIISIRNAKFQGKHGPMHAKYTMEVGKPDHVAIVAEWDGTKKKVRAWEQGRENKKVKQESYKLEDLRSGEVKIWRLMPRTWIGWAPKD
ncbi:hypothetical protein E0Z10_g5081 [Xylaria hypoxylon]|uniref:SH3 domain-containing protein n=1 Tax=Xylaria hypoxylon TaxID=37992 RepID=A0A4Z0Z281_9PEZI|nr:hypothetical protein E0Z10_g5081 [Xylaria hypoxylon]